MDQMQGIRVIIDRLGLPPRMAQLVKMIEDQYGPLEQLPEKGEAEVRRIRGYVDGENLLAAIVARMVNDIDVDEELLLEDEHKMDQRKDFDRWTDAAKDRPELTLLLINDSYYVAFDAAADRIADTIKEHTVIVEQHTAVSLSLERQADWLTALADANLDVALVAENPDAEGGYDVQRVLDMGAESPAEEGEHTEGGEFRPPETATPKIEQQTQPAVTDTTTA